MSEYDRRRYGDAEYGEDPSPPAPPSGGSWPVTSGHLPEIGTYEWGEEIGEQPLAGPLPPDVSLRQLTDRCWDMLGRIPPWARNDPQIQAAFQAQTNELDRIDAAMANVVANYFPYLAADHLDIWEFHLELPIHPPGISISDRQRRVIAHVYQRSRAVFSSSWVENVTALIGPSWTWTRHTPGSMTGVPAHTILVKLPYTADAPKATDLIKLLEIMTPANTVIQIQYGDGFLIQWPSGLIQTQPI